MVVVLDGEETARKVIAVAGGSGFIGRALVRRLAKLPDFKVRVLSRKPEQVREILSHVNAEFVRADVSEKESLHEALKDSSIIINAVQFDGFPVEDRARGLTFERIDYGGTLNLLESAQGSGTRHFIYISGASAEENSSHPAFRAKGLAERAITQSGLNYTIFRPSLVFGPEDRAVNMIVKALRFTPVFAVPGDGQQKLQPVFVEDLAECVERAITRPEAAANRIFEIGGPEVMTFDDFIKLIMEVTGRRRPIIHIPETPLRLLAGVAAMLPRPVFSPDALAFLTASNVCDVEPLVAALGAKLTPARDGLAYLRGQ